MDNALDDRLWANTIQRQHQGEISRRSMPRTMAPLDARTDRYGMHRPTTLTEDDMLTSQVNIPGSIANAFQPTGTSERSPRNYIDHAPMRSQPLPTGNGRHGFADIANLSMSPIAPNPQRSQRQLPTHQLASASYTTAINMTTSDTLLSPRQGASTSSPTVFPVYPSDPLPAGTNWTPPPTYNAVHPSLPLHELDLEPNVRTTYRNPLQPMAGLQTRPVPPPTIPQHAVATVQAAPTTTRMPPQLQVQPRKQASSSNNSPSELLSLSYQEFVLSRDPSEQNKTVERILMHLLFKAQEISEKGRESEWAVAERTWTALQAVDEEFQLAKVAVESVRLQD